MKNKFLLPNSYLILPSLCLVAPSPGYITAQLLLSSLLDDLTSWEANRELIRTPTGRIVVGYRQFVAEEFYRRVIDSDFLIEKPGKKLEKTVGAEADLWVATLAMLERISILVPFMEHSAIDLYALISERALMVLVATYSDGVVVAKEYIRNLQSQNRKLQGCENPFDRGEVPYTWEIVQRAIALSDTNDCFRRNFYMPVVRARQKLVTRMKEDRVRVFYQGKMQRQGRRKTK